MDTAQIDRQVDKKIRKMFLDFFCFVIISVICILAIAGGVSLVIDALALALREK